MLFLGDVHGRFDDLNKILGKNKKDTIIQVGDLGIGFGRDPLSFQDNFKFIRGNHDNPEGCKRYPNYMGDYGFDETNGMFWMGGAFSPDKDSRTIDIDWWRDEELSITQFDRAIAHYQFFQPKIVVTHDCPYNVASQLGFYDKTKTRSALQIMLDSNPPQAWVFGHYHRSFDVEFEGTRFVCLDCMELKDVTV